MGMVMNIPCSCDRADEWHKNMAFNHQLKCAFCNRQFSSFETLGKHVNVQHPGIGLQLKQALAKNESKEDVPMGKSIADMNRERGGGGPPMLHGSDLPRSVTSVKIKIKELRVAPDNFNSLGIIDFAEEVHGCEAFAVNITNLRSLCTIHGLDPETTDFDVLANKVKGKTLTLYATMVNNPKEKKMVRSLFFDSDQTKAAHG